MTGDLEAVTWDMGQWAAHVCCDPAFAVDFWLAARRSALFASVAGQQEARHFNYTDDDEDAESPPRMLLLPLRMQLLP